MNVSLKDNVSRLLRASVGGDTSNIADEDLDKYVADLILQDAKKKNSAYNSMGIRAFLPESGLPPNRTLKTNKRFLTNIIKATDDHNQALIREHNTKAQRNRATDEPPPRESDARDEQCSRRHRSHHRSPERGHRYSEDDRRDDRRRRRRDSESNDEQECTRSKRRHREHSPTPPRHSSPPSKPAQDTSPTVIHRGRGQPFGSTKMDKYFDLNYDPVVDIPDLGGHDLVSLSHPVDIESKEGQMHKKHKHKRHKNKERKEHKRHKHKRKRESSESSKEEGEGDYKDIWGPPPPREWDLAKVNHLEF